MRSSSSPGFQKNLFALPQASAVIGGRQIRNIATVGGNIVNASPAADLVPVLLALDAAVELRGSAERARCRSTVSWSSAAGPSAGPSEILTAVRFAKPPGAVATWFLKAGRRKAMEISVICVAAHLVRERQGADRASAPRRSRTRAGARGRGAGREARGAAAFGEAGAAAAETCHADRRRPCLGALPQAAGGDAGASAPGPRARIASERRRHDAPALDLTINGESHELIGRAALVRCCDVLRTRARHDRHQGELPGSRVRRLHRAARRQGGELVHAARRAVPGPLDRDHRRAGAIPAAASAAARLHRARRRAVRLLHSGHDPGGQGVPRRASGHVPSEAEVREALAGNAVPLHRLPEDRRSGDRGGRQRIVARGGGRRHEQPERASPASG